MLFTTISLIAALAGTTTALPPITNGTYLEIGPLPFAELEAQVKAIQASTKRDGLTKRTSEGVYLCDGQNFRGSCYWGSYPIGEPIYPDTYWARRLESVGPDNYNSDGGGNNACLFFAGFRCDTGIIQIFSYPGGNLDGQHSHNMGCFYCD